MELIQTFEGHHIQCHPRAIRGFNLVCFLFFRLSSRSLNEEKEMPSEYNFAIKKS